MKNTKRVAQIIAILLAIMMVIGVILFAMPSLYAKDDVKASACKEIIWQSLIAQAPFNLSANNEFNFDYFI